MFDKQSIENMCKFDSFEFWFSRISESEWAVSTTDRDAHSGEPMINDYSYNCDRNTVYDSNNMPVEGDFAERIKSDFVRFRTTRPEYVVGCQFNLIELSHVDRIHLYETLITGVSAIRAYANGYDPNIAVEKVQSCLEWLRLTDFYDAPASTIYHESYRGGLLYHTLYVVDQIIDCRKLRKFENVPLKNAVLVALVHDWCKIGLYESYTKNVKNDKTGQWEQVLAYKRKDPIMPLGHGVASMILARNYFRLSNEEMLAIRWHMGEYNVASNEMNELHSANEQYPLVQLIQFADRLSITKY